MEYSDDFEKESSQMPSMQNTQNAADTYNNTAQSDLNLTGEVIAIKVVALDLEKKTLDN